jgi:hypothetical protein
MLRQFGQTHKSLSPFLFPVSPCDLAVLALGEMSKRLKSWVCRRGEGRKERKDVSQERRMEGYLWMGSVSRCRFMGNGRKEEGEKRQREKLYVYTRRVMRKQGFQLAFRGQISEE